VEHEESFKRHAGEPYVLGAMNSRHVPLDSDALSSCGKLPHRCQEAFQIRLQDEVLG
jgi:hypothetical protein